MMQTRLLDAPQLGDMKTPRECNVQRISRRVARRYIIDNHYSHGCHNAPTASYGLFWKGELIGALVFAVPCSENVRASVFGRGTENEVTELHRLHIMDGTPKNTESWFISRCIRSLKADVPEIRAIISFADPMEGHVGTIYQATNAIYCGTSENATFYLDVSGKLHHPRHNGKNITVADAATRGWKPVKRNGKHRYLWLTDSSIREEDLNIAAHDYPKYIKGDVQ
jgi:hypothetical protein